MEKRSFIDINVATPSYWFFSLVHEFNIKNWICSRTGSSLWLQHFRRFHSPPRLLKRRQTRNKKSSSGFCLRARVCVCVSFFSLSTVGVDFCFPRLKTRTAETPDDLDVFPLTFESQEAIYKLAVCVFASLCVCACVWLQHPHVQICLFFFPFLLWDPSEI